ncbi:MAG: DUF58 domain-containing protein [Actinomycetota bacterium]|nr:DUF58 domain-containing protein [Actinomycetota bacterium]
MTELGSVAGWRPTGALRRSLVVGGCGVGGAIVLGEPALPVLVAPLVVMAAMGLLGRPTRTPSASARLDHVSLHEGQGTTSRLQLLDADDVEQATRVVDRGPHVACHPAAGRLSRMLRDGPPEVEISPRRWGRRTLGNEMVALTSSWAGFRWGPFSLPGSEMRVLPRTAAYTSGAQTPQPRGLVGAHRSARPGSGTEFAGIRAFEPGDRLRRINWRVSARTGRLHVTTTRSEQDAGILLVVDASADHGHSGGVDGAASSLDLAVRAAGSIAEHAIRSGDRVALRVVSGDGAQVGFGSGRLHLRRLLGTLAVVRPSGLGEGYAARLRLQATEGTMVVLLSPMLEDHIGTAAATLLHRGLPTLVIDTLPPDSRPAFAPDIDPEVADLAWRMRWLEREQGLAGLASRGCPVVAWRGPGTLDDVLRRLARHAEQPRVRQR